MLKACFSLVFSLISASRILYAADQSADINMANHYLQAAKDGDVKSEFFLGALYSAGVGVSLSDTEAFRWFLLAAEHGHSEACLLVGAMYTIGRGVPRSYVNAYKWASAAAASADLPETRSGAQQLLNLLVSRMSENDIAEGRKLAQAVIVPARRPTSSSNQHPASTNPPPASTSPPPASTSPPPASTNRPPASTNQPARPTVGEAAQPSRAKDSKDDQIAAKGIGRGLDYDRLTEEISRNPQNEDAYMRRGNLLTQKREYELASQDFSDAIRLNPNDARALNNRCWTRFALGQTESALADCDAALKIQPNFVDALDSRGLVNLKLGYLDRAVSDFNAALRIKPNLASSLYGRGVAQTRQGNKAAGTIDIASALAIDSSIADQLNKFGVRPIF